MSENKESFVFLKDQLVNSLEAKICIDERGFRFGDGVFETVRVENAVPFNLDWHLKRLQGGVRAIKMFGVDVDLKSEILSLVRKNSLVRGFVRISVSRGRGSRGYLPDSTKIDSPLVVIETIDGITEQGSPVSLLVSSYEKPSPKVLPTRYKLTQGLNSSLAKMEAVEEGYFESLMLRDKIVAEVASGNIFWVKGKEIYTPSLATGALEGSIRNLILKLDQSQYRINQGEYTIDDIAKADEIFITNVSWLVLSVCKINLFDKVWQQGGVATYLKKHIEGLIEEDAKSYRAKMV